MSKLSVSIAVLLLSGLFTQGAQAQSRTLSGQDFNIDLVTGPVLGSGRVIGLGGAYSALAYGADGSAWTPAAYASRTLWETEWFEWDLAFDYIPGTLSETDFDNNGDSGFAYSDFLFLTLGTRFVFGDFGFGGLARLQDYRIGDDADLRLILANYGAAYSFLQGQLLIGLAARTSTTTITDPAGRSLVSFTGSGPEVGALIAPASARFRIGFAARLAVQSGRNSSARVAVGLTLPQKLVLPAEIQLGFAYQLGPRPLNQHFVNPHDFEAKLRRELLARRHQRQAEQAQTESFARYLGLPSAAPLARGQAPDSADGEELPTPHDAQWLAQEAHTRQLEDQALRQALIDDSAERESTARALPRQYLLLSAEGVLTGETSQGVGLESFLTQQRQVSGRDVSLALHLGAEGEPIEGRLKLRLGTYFEPSRFAGRRYRAHGTLGTDLRLFRWDVFGWVEAFDVRIGASVDLAQRYSNIGFGLGFWH